MKRSHIVIKIFMVLLMATQLLQADFLAVKAEDIIPVSNEAEIRAVFEDLDANGGSKVIELSEDITVTTGDKYLRLNQGELTILGGGHKLTANYLISGSAVVNLSSEGYDKTTQFLSSRSDAGIFDIAKDSVLNIYDGTIIGPHSTLGMPGGISSHDSSTINMYGGTITDCHSTTSVSGAIYMAGNSVLNMYDGLITGCTGLQGGAIGLSGATPIGPPEAGSVVFNMYGGTISECYDKYIGGGAVCAYSAYPVKFNMYGGTITGCGNDGGYGYGGGIMIYCTAPGCEFNFVSGTVSGNSGTYGGGIFVFRGNVSISDGFSLHNNAAIAGGDDIYNNGASVKLGTADTGAVLNSCGHRIDGWYEDADSRWSYEECTGSPDHLELFTHTGEVFTEEYGLKAAHGKPLYTVTWLNYDGSVLELDEDVDDGEDPSYDGTVPVRPSDGTYNYTFSGWEPDLAPVHGDQTYTAVFTATPIPGPAPDPDPYYPIPKTGIE